MNTREQVLADLEALLRVASSAKYITRQISRFADLPTNVFPAIQIIDQGDSEVLHKTGGVATVSMDVKINIIVAAEYKNNTTILNNTEKEITTILFNNLKIGGSVDLIEIFEREAEDFEATYPFVVVSRNITIHYTGNVATGL